MMHPERNPMEETLAPSDRPLARVPALWDRLAPRFARTDPPGLCLSVETAHLLEQTCPPVEVSAALSRRLQAQVARAERDLAFEAAVAAGQRRFCASHYLAFLRQQAGLTVGEAAKRFAIDFHRLTDLERDALRPQHIPASRLASLLRRLRGSLEQAERLLPATIRAPRTLAAAQPGHLYRPARGASRSDAAAASRAARGEPARDPQPKYHEEIEAVHRLTRKSGRRGSAADDRNALGATLRPGAPRESSRRGEGN